MCAVRWELCVSWDSSDQLLTGKAGREGRQALGEVVDRPGQLQLGQVDAEDLLAPRDVGPVDADLAVKPAASA